MERKIIRNKKICENYRYYNYCWIFNDEYIFWHSSRYDCFNMFFAICSTWNNSTDRI